MKLFEYKQNPITSWKEIVEKGYSYNGSTCEERMGSPEGKCPECGKSDWAICPCVIGENDGGKTYIECIHCGYPTHL